MASFLPIIPSLRHLDHIEPSETSSSSSSSYGSFSSPKPHKANNTAWEAMRRLRAKCGGRVGLEHFRLIRRVGSGDIGSVYLCKIRNPAVGQCLYAMKVVDMEAVAARKKAERAETEKEILCMLDHPFLPTLYAHFQASHYSCLVMEFCPGGDLYSARLNLPSRRFPASCHRPQILQIATVPTDAAILACQPSLFRSKFHRRQPLVEFEIADRPSPPPLRQAKLTVPTRKGLKMT